MHFEIRLIVSDYLLNFNFYAFQETHSPQEMSQL